MNIICKTCGGECIAADASDTAVTYKCKWCGNVYVIKRGEEGLFNRAEAKYTPKTEAVKKEPSQSDTPRTMPETTPAKHTPLSGEEVFEKNIDSVIEIRAARGGKAYNGSGYAIDDKGTVITNAHVVAADKKPAADVKAYVCGKTFPAEVIKISPDEDLALIKVKGAPAAMKGVKFADIFKVRNGQMLYVIGNSLGGGTCITSGIVSDKRRDVGGKPRLMTDCAVNKGNSGGPVFNDEGEVVGTVVAVTTAAEGMNYAIPADIVQKFISESGIKI
ncbi:MAG: serine protease [Clostridia bacterium]|nr:serine protease [Clostridia bacterium]